MKKMSFWKVTGLLAVAAGLLLVTFPAQAALGEPTPWGMNFQEHATPMKERMEGFHNRILLPIIAGICLLVLGLLLFVMIRFNAKANPVPSKTTHNTLLEIIWTSVPVAILIAITLPSMHMLYYIDKTPNPEMTLKVTGFQWYWGYEYPDHGGIAFDARIDREKKPHLLATDNEVILPVDTDIQLLVTANDVVHAWAVPAFGVKMDAVPGRTNETWVRIEKEGTFYGQCSELCGTDHGFMPIQVRAVSKEEFANWVQAQGGKMPEAAQNAEPQPGRAEAATAEE